MQILNFEATCINNIKGGNERYNAIHGERSMRNFLPDYAKNISNRSKK